MLSIHHNRSSTIFIPLPDSFFCIYPPTGDKQLAFFFFFVLYQVTSVGPVGQLGAMGGHLFDVSLGFTMALEATISR